MKLFQSKQEKQLDALLFRLQMNMSNNYKDAAQEDFAELEKLFAELSAADKLRERAKLRYEKQIGIYREKLKGFTHKDQKPYWTR